MVGTVIMKKMFGLIAFEFEGKIFLAQSRIIMTLFESDCLLNRKSIILLFCSTLSLKWSMSM
jgi:hypothetical protein